MAETRFYKELKEIAEQMLAQLPTVENNGGKGRDLHAIDRQLIESVHLFASEHRALASHDEGKTQRSSKDNSWLGNLAGRSLAEKLRCGGANLQNFFTRYSEVKSDFIDRLNRIESESYHPQGFVSLDVFFSGLAAGFVQEWVRCVKTAFRRRQQDAKLYILREKKRYATVFHRMSEPAFVVDRDLCLIDVNSSFEKFFGIPRSEAIGLSCCELIGRDICEGCPLEEILSTGGSFSNVEISTSLLYAKGSVPGVAKTMLMAASALGNPREGNQGGIVIFQDITDRKRTEEELEKYRNWLEDLVDERTDDLLKTNEALKKEIAERRHIEKELIEVTASLKRSNAELEHFAHVVSHDLREPLMLIASFAERLMARYYVSLDERGRNYLARIKKGTGTLQNLVDALFQMSRVVTSAARFEPLDLNELVRDVIDDLEEIVDRSGARIEIGTLHRINGDAVQIRQLFQNLISNAIKYHKKDVVPSVSISSRIVGEVCEIAVEDNGIGFDEADMEKIFEPFVRLHGRDIYEGTGMGLTTCKKIVTRHDGEILAHSKPESGATFIVRLPLRHYAERR